jgi:hypothetical protein
MASSLEVRDMQEALGKRLFPTITTWNRLEARPRSISFDRALRAEVRDALWMLTKQWQMGEFRGSDAGSPVFAKVQMDLTRLTKYRPDTHATRPFEYDVPFDVKVESRPVSLTRGQQHLALDLRVAIGRYWLALVAGVGPYRQAFIDAYPIAAANPALPEDADICAHTEGWQWYAALAGRAMDGGRLVAHLQADPANHAYDGVNGIAAAGDAVRDAIDGCASRLLAWWQRVIQQPSGGEDAWNPSQLQYQFAASAPLPGGAEKVYVADAYYQQELDWYSVDVETDVAALDTVTGSETTGVPADTVGTTIPVPVSFAGMPNTRWWTFEDRKTNFGDIDAATTDLAKLLFIEFALVYSNDWFVIPYTLPSGTIATMRGFVVNNVFGERFLIDAAGTGADADWQRWSLFTVDVRGQAGVPADTSLLLLPRAAKRHESPPAEDVMLVRDKVANMVWGVETLVPLANGEARRGLEAARQTRAWLEALLAASGAAPPVAAPPAAPIGYQVMSTVPENWIPFIPVHVENNNREIQLQRAALPRILAGDPAPPVKVRPRTTLLREGLDATPAQPYFIFEEEIPRAGTRLMQAFERTRWTDGRIYTWLRARRQTGRGEASSGLGFDKLKDMPSSDAK